MKDRDALKLLMGLTDAEITDLGGFPDDPPTTTARPSGVYAWMRPSDILTALNTAVEDINTAAGLPETGTIDALQLMLNYTYDLLFNNVTDLDGCVAQSYDNTTVDDIVGWINS